MQKTSSLSMPLGLLLILGAAFGPNKVFGAERPNVLFLCVDDLRPALGCYGDNIAQTPNMDRLAEKSMVFHRAYCQQAVCCPSRLSLLTGRRPDTIQVWDLATHFRETIPDLVTLPQHFKNSGYTTQSIGKIFHGSGAPSKDPPSWSKPPQWDHVRDPKLRYALRSNLKGKGLKRSSTEAAPVGDDYYSDGKICESAEEALAELAAEDRPFFLAVGFRKPHLPFCAPEKYWKLYDRNKIPLPMYSGHPIDAPELATRSWRELEGYEDIPNSLVPLGATDNSDGKTLPTEKIRELRHGYYACVSYVDALIGRVLRKLDEVGKSQNTIVVLVGDHGFHLGEQGIWAKANNFELSTRVPLIVRDPRKRAGSTQALVEFVDVYPTLAELCELATPEGTEGCSFIPVMTEPSRDWKLVVFSQYPRMRKGNRHKKHGEIMGYAVRNERYRYVEWREWTTKKVVAKELYDHQTDPHESRNVIVKLPEAAKAMSQTLAAGWQEARPKEGAGEKEGEDSAELLERRRNVLFLAVDDMKDWVNCLGGYEGTVHTPNIDRLASQGMLFTNAHCASPKCAPSRAAILTGLRPSTTGLYDNGHWWYPNYPSTQTIPTYFRESGYQVVGAGKIFHHTAGNNPPNQWDDFLRLTFRCDPWFRGVKLNYPWSEHTPYPKGFPFSGLEGLGHENDWGALPISVREYDDELTSDYAVGFLNRHSHAGNAGKPFFLACGIFRPHLPWYVPQEYFDLYPIEEVVLPRAPADDLDDIPMEGLAFAEARRSDLQTIRKAAKLKQAVRAYLASISYADAQIGKVLDALDSSGMRNDTIVVLWSDHGWHLGEKQHWHKTTLWEEATRVPLIIDSPGTEPSRCSRPVSLLDLFPTLVELCPSTDSKASSDLDVDGLSLVPLLENPAAIWTRPAITEYKRGNIAIRSQRYRYIQYAKGGEELYDHSNDPNEWNNLANDESYAQVRSDLKRWIPHSWAESAKKKSSYSFDPQSYSWVQKETGNVIRGNVR